MRMIVRLAVTPTNLTATSLPENEHAAYSAATNYWAGNRVIYENQVFECLVDNTQGVTPSNSGAEWVLVSATNRYKAFDAVIGDQASAADEITYRIEDPSIVNAMAFFNVDADTVQVQVTDATDGEVFNETRNMRDDSRVIDFFTWFFEPIRVLSKTLFLDLPAYEDAQIDVTVTKAGGTAKVGQIVPGREYRIGSVTSNVSVGYEDFSTKEEDIFGRITLVERGYIETADYQVAVLKGDVEWVRALLVEQRARPAVFYPGPDLDGYGATIFGIVGEFEATHDPGNHAFYDLEVRGLT